MDDKCSKVFNACHGKLGSQWLNVVLCKNLGLKLATSDFNGLRLGANIGAIFGAKLNALKKFDGGLRPIPVLHPEVYKYSHSAYSQSSFLFYGDSVINICEGTQQGDPESPAVF